MTLQALQKNSRRANNFTDILSACLPVFESINATLASGRMRDGGLGQVPPDGYGALI
jgi:hypothetical protein